MVIIERNIWKYFFIYIHNKFFILSYPQENYDQQIKLRQMQLKGKKYYGPSK